LSAARSSLRDLLSVFQNLSDDQTVAGVLTHQNGNAARARDLYIQAAELAIQYGQINLLLEACQGIEEALILIAF
jgi:hypothetical protein